MAAHLARENSEDRRFVDSEVFRNVIGNFTSGVTIITARHNDTNFGITASAVTSLSMNPPMLLVCINKQTGTCHAVSEAKSFGVNILYEDQGDLALQFARPSMDKFAGTPITYGELGEPLLQNVLANLECRVVEEVTGGTHSVFLAEVQNAWAAEGAPLAYFKGKFGRFQGANDEMVYRRIRRMVLERDLQAGHTLTLSQLSTQLDAPRQSVYYAMTRLESEGLVTREGEGYHVQPLDAKTLADALDARCALEIAAAERTVGRLRAEELAELQKRMQDTLQGMSGSETAVERYLEANTAFHDYLVAVAGNPTLLEAYRRLTVEAVMNSALRVALEADDETSREELARLNDDHLCLTTAYAAGDVEEVKRVIRQHTEEAKQLGRYLIDHAGGRI